MPRYSDDNVKAAIINPTDITTIPGLLWLSNVKNFTIIAWAIRNKWSYDEEGIRINALAYATDFVQTSKSKSVVYALQQIIERDSQMLAQHIADFSRHGNQEDAEHMAILDSEGITIESLEAALHPSIDSSNKWACVFIPTLAVAAIIVTCAILGSTHHNEEALDS